MTSDEVCEPEVFDNIYVTNANNLRNFLYYKYGDLKAAEDVVQESFIKLWVNCTKVAIEKAKSFLFTVANNLFIDIKRHEKIVLTYKKRGNSSVNKETPEFIMQEKEFMDKLQITIGSLPDKQREVFLLNRIDKKTYKEIAEMLDLSVKAVEKRMQKALIIVRKKIGNI
ncbi:MAG: RNA polymerase subunit sigma-70 [Bacteroidetes bacterium]|nr:MAG: RNA polymerase subunit sigma-70 [Bacteroidota bacterium]